MLTEQLFVFTKQLLSRGRVVCTRVIAVTVDGFSRSDGFTFAFGLWFIGCWTRQWWSVVTLTFCNSTICWGYFLRWITPCVTSRVGYSSVLSQIQLFSMTRKLVRKVSWCPFAIPFILACSLIPALEYDQWPWWSLILLTSLLFTSPTTAL